MFPFVFTEKDYDAPFTVVFNLYDCFNNRSKAENMADFHVDGQQLVLLSWRLVQASRGNYHRPNAIVNDHKRDKSVALCFFFLPFFDNLLASFDVCLIKYKLSK